MLSLPASAARAGTAANAPAVNYAAGPTAVGYVAPVPSPIEVLRHFNPPATPYGPGHLGVDLRAPQAGQVVTAADGVITFAGQVAGRGVVVVLHADGIRTEYEPLTPAVATGATVRRGQLIGHLHGSHRGCALSCLHWGARRGASYLDPLSLLRPLGPVVLLPWPSTSGARMRALVGVPQPFDRDVRVELRRGEARVSEHLLNAPQVSAPVE